MPRSIESRRHRLAASVLGRAAAVLGLAALSGPAAAATPLSGADIEAALVDKRVFLSTPLGGEFPLVYRSGGVVEGDGEGVGLGRWVAPKDRGRWWIDGDRLCQVWTAWYDGEEFCFTLTRTGPAALRWQRDDGLSGTARVAP